VELLQFSNNPKKRVFDVLNRLKKLIEDDQAQGMTEYAFVLGIIAVAFIAILGSISDRIIEMYSAVLISITGS
jgi:pilus assembly protein Flp/PilA